MGKICLVLVVLRACRASWNQLTRSAEVPLYYMQQALAWARETKYGVENSPVLKNSVGQGGKDPTI